MGDCPWLCYEKPECNHSNKVTKVCQIKVREIGSFLGKTVDFHMLYEMVYLLQIYNTILDRNFQFSVQQQ